MALYKPVKLGDKVRDSNGDEWTITRVHGNVAYYDKLMHEIYRDKSSKLVDNCFIAVFSGDGKDGCTYNRNMTLVEESESC